jgi:small subunit ribosomal protein S27e
MKKPHTKFLKIACPRCKCPQIIFSKSATMIKCVRCNKRLIDTTGGKTRLRAPVKQIWN